MAKSPTNIAASVRARLLNLARKTRRPLDQLLTRYALERLLYRLSLSAYRDRYALKGALLVTTWFDTPHRPTRDVDFLGFGDPSTDVLVARFREIAARSIEDGLVYDIDALKAELIREEQHYGGVRLRTTATLAGARIPIVIDVGFGDATEPGLQEIELPVLLDMPAPHLLAYPTETVIAEKFEAMVKLGLANSRAKDHYDVWALLTTRELDSERLASAIAATFKRRGTDLPTDTPDALTAAFAADDAGCDRRRRIAAIAGNLRARALPTAGPPQCARRSGTRFRTVSGSRESIRRSCRRMPPVSDACDRLSAETEGMCGLVLSLRRRYDPAYFFFADSRASIDEGHFAFQRSHGT